MPSMNLEVPHSLAQEEAVERMKSLLDKIHDKYGDQIKDIEQSWQGSTLSFSFKTFGFKIGGTVEVQDEVIKFTGSLPIAAMAFRGKIESSIRGELEKCLQTGTG